MFGSRDPACPLHGTDLPRISSCYGCAACNCGVVSAGSPMREVMCTDAPAMQQLQQALLPAALPRPGRCLALPQHRVSDWQPANVRWLPAPHTSRILSMRRRVPEPALAQIKGLRAARSPPEHLPDTQQFNATLSEHQQPATAMALTTFGFNDPMFAGMERALDRAFSRALGERSDPMMAAFMPALTGPSGAGGHPMVRESCCAAAAHALPEAASCSSRPACSTRSPARLSSPPCSGSISSSCSIRKQLHALARRQLVTNAAACCHACHPCHHHHSRHTGHR